MGRGAGPRNATNALTTDLQSEPDSGGGAGEAKLRGCLGRLARVLFLSPLLFPLLGPHWDAAAAEAAGYGAVGEQAASGPPGCGAMFRASRVNCEAVVSLPRVSFGRGREACRVAAAEERYGQSPV